MTQSFGEHYTRGRSKRRCSPIATRQTGVSQFYSPLTLSGANVPSLRARVIHVQALEGTAAAATLSTLLFPLHFHPLPPPLSLDGNVSPDDIIACRPLGGSNCAIARSALRGERLLAKKHTRETKQMHTKIVQQVFLLLGRTEKTCTAQS